MKDGKKSFVFGLILLAFLAAGNAALAQQGTEPLPIRTEIVVPGSPVELTPEGFIRGRITDLAQYIGVIYAWLISIVGIVAAVFVMVGGFQYLIARGDASKISAAKDRIVNALIGLALALGAFVILNTVNPALTTLKIPELSDIDTEISHLPWCEDLEAAGKAVTLALSYDGKKDCGTVGEYREGNANSYCAYRGSGSEACVVSSQRHPFGGGDMPTPLTCIPDVKFGPREAAQRVKDFREMSWSAFLKKYEVLYGGGDAPKCPTCAMMRPAGGCYSCQGAAYYNFMKYGKKVPPNYCAFIETTVNRGAFNNDAFARVQAFGQNFVQYCRYDADEQTCVGAVINCQQPVPVSGGCWDGYNYGNHMWFYSIQDGREKVGAWAYGDRIAVTGSHPGHLQNICFANPCNYNSIKNGCKGESGTVAGIRNVANAVRDGIVGINACDNR